MYYVLTPLDVTYVMSGAADTPLYFSDASKYPYALEKTYSFKVVLPLLPAEFQANHYEVLGLDVMY